MSTPPPDDERFEHIPWEQIAPAGNRNRVILYALAGAVLVAGLTANLVRGGSDGDGPAELVATPTTAAEKTVTTLAVASSSTGTSAAHPVEDETPPWSEADLMAVPSESLAAEAAALAEWLASDFFTLDGGVEIARDLGRMLPEGSQIPLALPGSRSFVEWARAITVEETLSGVFDVLVVVRRLGAAEGESYRRMPPIAVLLRIAWTEEGWSVADLPALAESPVMVQAPPWSQTEVPADIVAAVARGRGGEVIAGVAVGDLWRLVVQIEDVAGASWPMVIWTDSTGNRIPVPAPPGQP